MRVLESPDHALLCVVKVPVLTSFIQPLVMMADSIGYVISYWVIFE